MKRSARLPSSRVLPATKQALDELSVILDQTAVVTQIMAVLALYGDVDTSQGKVREVLAKELQR